MSKSNFKLDGGATGEGLDKVDMSLDDIIRLNKKQKQMHSQKATHRALVKGHLNQGRMSGSRAGVPSKRGGVVEKCFSRNHKLQPPVARRPGQGVITGLAARKNTALLKGISPLSRSAQNQPMLNRKLANNSAVNQRYRPFVQQRDTQKPQSRPFWLCKKWNVPSAQQSQREARQATFLFKRGLKVQAQFQNKLAPPTQRIRTWRTPTNSGILTVSIGNPTARTQLEHAQSWSLHPLTSTHLSPSSKEETERKAPKGVAVQFDINSVGKQTGITLNERFRIFKDQRVVTAPHQSSKGGRFVTVA